MLVADERVESDGDLFHRIMLSDPESVARLYDRYGGLAFALAYRILNDRGAAEDVVQEAFLNVWRRADTYDAKRGTARAWLLTVVHHQAINHLRAVRSRGGAAADIDAIPSLTGAEDIAATVERGMEGERVRTALDLAQGGRRGGWELAQRLWGDRETTHIPAIVLAVGPRMLPVRGELLRAMRCRIVRRPFVHGDLRDLHDLLAAIEGALRPGGLSWNPSEQA